MDHTRHLTLPFLLCGEAEGVSFGLFVSAKETERRLAKGFGADRQLALSGGRAAIQSGIRIGSLLPPCLSVGHDQSLDQEQVARHLLSFAPFSCGGVWVLLFFRSRSALLISHSL